MNYKETETTELKKTTSELKEAIIGITAILNKHQKGELYFGIRNNGTIIGQQVTENTIREISKSISDHIEPKIYPKIKEILIEEKKCIQIEFTGNTTPYYAYGRPYIRVGDENKQLSAKELENLILKKSETKWDSKTTDTSIEEIDEETLKEFIQKANQSQRINFNYTNKKEALEKLNLIKDTKPTNAAQLLFSKNQPIEVQAAIFAGTDKTSFLDIKQFKGNILQLLKVSELYIKQHMKWQAKLVERTRQEIPEIPIRAITETLVNSFCHRDYQAPESNKIAIYKDKIEIWNPGDFPEGYKPQDFIQQHLPSILRNPQIANTLYLSSDIEKWGSGLKRIHEECQKNKIQAEFKTLKYGFTVQFTRPKKDTVNGTLNNTEKQILEILSNNPNTTIDEIAKNLNKGRRTITRHLNKLKEKNKIKRIGSDKTGHWETTNTDN